MVTRDEFHGLLFAVTAVTIAIGWALLEMQILEWIFG